MSLSCCGKAKWSATTPANLKRSRRSPTFISFQSEWKVSSFKQIDFSNSQRVADQKGPTDATDVFFLFTTQLLQRHSSSQRWAWRLHLLCMLQMVFFWPHKVCAGVFPRQQSHHVLRGLLNSSFVHSEGCSRFLWLTTSSCTSENQQVVFTHGTT